MTNKNVSIAFLTLLLLPIGLIASTLALLLIPFLLIIMPILALGVAGKAGGWLAQGVFDWLYPTTKNAPIPYSHSLPQLILQTVFTVILYPFAVVFSLVVLVCIAPLAYPALAGVVAHEMATLILKDCFKAEEEQLPLSKTEDRKTEYEEEPLSHSIYGTFFNHQLTDVTVDYSNEKEVVYPENDKSLFNSVF